MNGYSKMGVATEYSAKSRSEDFSGLNVSPPAAKEAQEMPSPTKLKAPQREDATKPQDLFSWQQESSTDGRSGGVVLSRTFSSASHRFRADERANGGSTSLPTVVRRAFSNRKGSPVAEGYWRIHDTADEYGELMEDQQLQMRHGRTKKGRILKACKKFFGL